MPFLIGAPARRRRPFGSERLALCDPITVRTGFHLRSASLEALARDVEVLRAALGYAEHDPNPDIDAFMTAVERTAQQRTQIRSTQVEILVVQDAAYPLWDCDRIRHARVLASSNGTCSFSSRCGIVIADFFERARQ